VFVFIVLLVNLLATAQVLAGTNPLETIIPPVIS